MHHATIGLRRPFGSPSLLVGSGWLDRLRRRSRRRSRRRLGQESRSARPTGLGRLPGGPRLARALTGLTTLALLNGLYWLLESPRFGLHTFQVDGLRTLSAREVVVQSGLEGQNVFRTRPAQAAQRVSQLPGVRRAWVRLRLPDFGLIEIEERQPILLWQTGERLYGIDPEGVVIPPTGVWEGAMTVVDTQRSPLEMGAFLEMDVLGSALEVQARLPGVKTIEYSRGEGLILRTPQGWPVYLGLSDALGFKLAVLEELVPSLADQGLPVKFIDLRLPTHPIVARQGA